MESLRRLGLAVLLAVGVFSSVSASADAQAPDAIAVTQAPGALAYPGAIGYEIRATTDANPADFGISWSALARWTSDYRVGSAISFSAPSLTGGGTLTPLPPPSTPPVLILVFNQCFRSSGNVGDEYQLEMPAHSEAVISLIASLTAPPWPGGASPGVDYTTQFRTFTERYGPRTTIASFSPSIGPPSGIRIDIRKAGAQRFGPRRKRVSPPLVGSTTPAVANKHIALRAIHVGLDAFRGRRTVSLSDWESTGSSSLGSVMTTADGTFAVKRHRLPRALSSYRVLARIDDPGAGLAADWNCGPTLPLPKRLEPDRTKPKKD